MKTSKAAGCVMERVETVTRTRTKGTTRMDQRNLRGGGGECWFGRGEGGGVNIASVGGKRATWDQDGVNAAA